MKFHFYDLSDFNKEGLTNGRLKTLVTHYSLFLMENGDEFTQSPYFCLFFNLVSSSNSNEKEKEGSISFDFENIKDLEELGLSILKFVSAYKNAHEKSQLVSAAIQSIKTPSVELDIYLSSNG